MTENTAANGAHTTNGIPAGYTTLTPFIALADPAAALEFYQKVFGARVINSTAFDGVVVHAEIEFDHGRLQLGAPSPGTDMQAVDPSAPATFSFAYYCADVDAVIAAAVDAGATQREETMNFVSGDRFGSVVDPFGVRWNVMTRIEDLSDAESDARVKEWAATQGA